VELALITVVAAHLLAVNLAGAGPLVMVWLDWLGGRRQQPQWRQAALRLGWWSIAAAAVGVALGTAAMAQLFYWPPKTHQAYQWIIRDRVPEGRWWFVAAEVLCYFTCMLACVLLWRRLERRPWVRFLLAIAAGTNVLYHFPALFTVLAMMFEQRDISYGMLDRQTYFRFLLTSNALARVTHVLLASFAVAGLMVSWIGWRLTQTDSSNSASAIARLGGRLALAASLLQFPVGVWVLLALPEGQSQRIMTTGAAIVFGIGVVTALGLMHQLAMVALGDASRRRLSVATLMMVLVVVLMTATLQLARG
jgi:hypothetical protein